MEQRFSTPAARIDPLSGVPRVLTTLAAYVPATWTGENLSGILPLGARVLILPDVAEEQTQGGIHLPPDVAARNGMAAETGVLVALGESAFRSGAYSGKRPAIGARVVIERYSGQLQRGLDGQIYRICEDRALGALLAVKQDGDSA